jgi:chitodextrinase
LARVIGTLALSGDTQAPTQPQNLSATAINRQRVDLSWTASTDNIGVTGYQVFRNAAPLNTSATTTYSDTTASASTTYTYTVVAFDAAGNNSAPSASAQATTPANAAPSWATIPTQTLIVGDSYSLNLNDYCTDADADTIQYSIISGTLPTGITRSGAVISGVPTTAGQTPTITVRAFDGFVNTDTTIVYATWTADTTAPPVPTGLAATAVSSAQINLAWNTSPDVSGGANHFVSGTQDYRLYRSTDQVNFSLRTTVTANSYSDTGLSATTRYDYKVTARDVELNESAQSSAVNATTTAAFNAKADFLARATASSSVLYATDFDDVILDGVIDVARSGINTSTELRAEAFETGPNGTTATNLESTIKLSGNSCRLTTEPDANTSTNGYWAFRPDGRTATVRRRFYVQFSVYYPSETIGYRYLLNSGTNGALKVINLNQPGAGQLVITQPRFMGFPGGFINGNTSIPESMTPAASFASNPWSTTVHHTQTAVDGGTPNPITSGNTKTEWLTRYGPLLRGLSSDIDGSYNAGNPYLYNRTQPSGWPDTRAAINGVPFALDDWQTFEIFYDYNTSDPSQSSCQVWVNRGYGSPPVLIISAIGNLSFGTSSSAVSRIELLNYDTERLAEVGVRPTQYTYYAEPIVSLEPIDFPGGYAIPGHQGGPTALSQDMATLSAGGSKLSTAIATTGLTTSNTINGNVIPWQSRGFYDELRRQIYYMGKSAQSQGGDGRHYVYDEDDNTWDDGFPSFLAGSNSGHVYEAHTYDPDAGDQYFLQYGTKTMRFLAQGANIDTGWELDHASNYPFASTFNGVTGEHASGWFPNLNGAGDGGVVNVSGIGLMAWRKSTNTWAQLNSYSLGGTINHGAACYSRGLNALICTLGTDLRAYRVDQGPTVTAIQNTPINFSYDTGVLLDDPNEGATVYALEKLGSRVWKYSAGTWALQAFTHPFQTTASWVGITLYGMGGFLGIERFNNFFRFRLWKPNS